MTLHAQTPRTRLLFYGWYILAASFIILFCKTAPALLGRRTEDDHDIR
jgi:hypothetical protein